MDDRITLPMPTHAGIGDRRPPRLLEMLLVAGFAAGMTAGSTQTAMKQDGTPALILNLAGGGELPIDMRPDVLAKRYAAIG